MCIKVLVPDSDCDCSELEAVSNHIGMHLFCQLVQDLKYLGANVRILFKGGVSAY